MTSTIKYNLDQLDQFRSAASSEAGRVGSLGDDMQLTVSSTAFGQNSGSSAMSAAIEAIGAHLQQEFAHAEDLLRDVSRSVDSVQAAIQEADKNGSRMFSTTSAAGISGGSGGYSSSGSGGGGGGGSGGGGGTAAAASPNAGTAPPVTFGHGVEVDLPQGLGKVEAPNAKAAGAVREALTQLGVPYVWGAETAGKGFDCSGLTSWAYGKEGVDLPHDAAAQNTGEQVPEKNLAPGDLVVWDGHVAMYIGNGHVIEAPHTGEDVHIVPLYTQNGTDAFEGFWRPTA